MRLQSANPAPQAAMPQRPFAQEVAAFAARQGLPQVPQLEVLVRVSVSQPSWYSPLQSLKPLWQKATPHLPFAQPGAPLAAVQTVPQLPQFRRSEVRSKPSSIARSQSSSRRLQISAAD
jgi:hypothetical protein